MTEQNLAITQQQKHLVLAVLGILAMVLVFAVKLGLSDVYGYQAKRIVLRWEKSAGIINDAELESALSYIETARWLEPNFPDYAETEAQIYIWQYHHQRRKLDEAQAKTLLNKALTLYRHALNNQPSWPYAWLGVVDSKILLGEFDDELTHAIERTITLGGFEAQVQFDLVNMTFPHLAKFDKTTRKIILSAYDSSLQGNANLPALIKLGEAKGIFMLYCLKPDLTHYGYAVQRHCAKLMPEVKVQQ